MITIALPVHILKYVQTYEKISVFDQKMRSGYVWEFMILMCDVLAQFSPHV